MQCKTCGAEITLNSKFCPECGVTQVGGAANDAASSVARGEPSFKSEAIALSPSDESLHQPSKFGSVVSHKLVCQGRSKSRPLGRSKREPVDGQKQGFRGRRGAGA